MFVLVTGGAGFIGSHAVERLLMRGARVRVLDNFSAGARANLPQHADLEVVVGDVRDGQFVEAAAAGVSHILHLAAQVSVAASLQAPGASAANNLVGFVNVLESARRQGVGKVVYASSAAVFGAPQNLPVDEDTPLHPLSPYGLEKAVNEQYARLFAELYGLSCLGLRYFNVYGPRQDPASPYAGVISRFMVQSQHSECLAVYGDGMQTRDFVYVGDVAEATLRALESTATGVCNVGCGHSVTLLELIQAIERIQGSSARVEHAPARQGDIRYSATAIGRLQRELNYHPATTLAEGLQRLKDWLERQPVR